MFVTTQYLSMASTILTSVILTCWLPLSAPSTKNIYFFSVYTWKQQWLRQQNCRATPFNNWKNNHNTSCNWVSYFSLFGLANCMIKCQELRWVPNISYCNRGWEQGTGNEWVCHHTLKLYFILILLNNWHCQQLQWIFIIVDYHSYSKLFNIYFDNDVICSINVWWLIITLINCDS